ATHRDLERLISEGKFREDLYYRLNVFPITMPPLRDRPSDIALLVQHFMQKFAQSSGKVVTGVDPRALASLSTYPWPGNVRELENVIERAMILASGPTLSVADLDFGRRLAMTPSAGSPLTTTADSGSAEGGRSLYRRLSEQERGEIVAAVEGAQGNIAHAARTLGINRSTLYYRMRKHGLEHLLPTKDDVPGSLDGASNG
ncbi:MAG TPA: helix-turn-helix domain-containing protein, partial [Polyangia bacterium]